MSLPQRYECVQCHERVTPHPASKTTLCRCGGVLRPVLKAQKMTPTDWNIPPTEDQIGQLRELGVDRHNVVNVLSRRQAAEEINRLSWGRT